MERREDGGKRDRIDTIQQNYVKWMRLSVIILVVIVAIQILFGVAAVYLNGKIKDSLHDSLVIQCDERSVSHDKTLVKLDDLIDDNVPEAQRDKVRESNTILIDEAIPKFKDCNARADQLIKGQKGH
jgi:hypothetical protein